jgi:hypothetical protein
MIRLMVAASLGVALIASSAEATVYCNADGTPQGCVWEPNPGVGARGVGVVPGVGAGAAGVGVAPGVGARGVGVEPGVGVGRDGVDGEMNVEAR